MWDYSLSESLLFAWNIQNGSFGIILNIVSIHFMWEALENARKFHILLIFPAKLSFMHENSYIAPLNVLLTNIWGKKGETIRDL